MQAPLYAARTNGALREEGLDVRFLSHVARDERLERLRSSAADLALIELASVVDTVAEEPGFGARCVLVLARHAPMASLFVTGRPAGGGPIESPEDLLRARYGGDEGSAFVAHHRALLRRLGEPAPGLHVETPYDALPAALAAGDIDVVPDYAALATTYRRALGPGQELGILRTRECGVRAYGVGLVASARALRDRRDDVEAFLRIAGRMYAEMLRDPEPIVERAAETFPDLDPEFALHEWRDDWEDSIFGERGPGPGDAEGWAETAAWRREVRGGGRAPAPEELFEGLGGPTAGGGPGDA